MHTVGRVLYCPEGRTICNISDNILRRYAPCTYIHTTQPFHAFSSHRTYLAQVSFPQDGRNGLGSQRRAEGSPHQHDASKKTLEERGGGGRVHNFNDIVQFCRQVMIAYVAETSCNQLLMID